MSADHPHNVIRALSRVGYTLNDLLPAFPGKDARYVDELARDNAFCLSRPVLPYGLLGVHEHQSRYFNVGAHGARLNGRSQPWPPDPAKTNIFFFGGSTTLGILVEDGETVPANVERELRRSLDVEVYNFGAGNYTLRHELLRLLDLADHELRPDLCIFLDGYNDAQYALGNYQLVEALDFLYQSEKKRRRMSGVGAVFDYLIERVKPGALPSGETYQKEMRPEFAHMLENAYIDEALAQSDAPPALLDDAERRIAEIVWRRYLMSLELAQAIVARIDSRGVYFWQPAPFFAVKAEQRLVPKVYKIFRHGVFSHPVYRWLLRHDMSDLPRGVTFKNLAHAGRGVEGPLYLDTCHYTPLFCRTLGAAIADIVKPLIC